MIRLNICIRNIPANRYYRIAPPSINKQFQILQSGITYYAPQTQPPPRPILAQRRPTNAIPILAPPERGGGGGGGSGSNGSTSKNRGRLNNPTYDEYDEDAAKNPQINAPLGSSEIDHILDNMFVQRAPYQPPTRKSSSPTPDTSTTVGIAKTTSAATPLSTTIDSNADNLVPGPPSFDGTSGQQQLEYADVGMGVRTHCKM